MDTTLTPKQKQFLDLLQKYTSKSGLSPTLSELGEILHITKRAVVKYLEVLERKGLIVRSSEPRSIKLTKEIFKSMLQEVSILGFANAGSPLVYAEEENLGTLRVDRGILPVSKNIFAVIIKGDSMNKRAVNGTQLKDGDYAIIAKDQDVKDGDVVLAIIDNCATIKTIKKDRNLIVLYPESTNTVHKPIYLSRGDETIIYGKVITVLGKP